MEAVMYNLFLALGTERETKIKVLKFFLLLLFVSTVGVFFFFFEDALKFKFFVNFFYV